MELNQELTKGIILEPYAYFNNFFTDELFNLIATETNKYAVQNNAAFKTSVNEIKLFLGMLIRMSIMKLPRIRSYWSGELNCVSIAEKMSRDRFEQINKYIHFCDNNKLIISPDNKDYDRFFKVRPLLDIVRNACLQVEAEYNQCVDEQMIPFKGKSGLKRYIPSKPTKWGFKVFTRNGSSGVIHDFFFEDGAMIYDGESSGFRSSDIVLKLATTCGNEKKHHFYYDNYFSTLSLHSVLSRMGHLSTSTMRNNRSRKCPLTNPKNFKKQLRGHYEYALNKESNAKINVVRWLDGSVVTLTSTAHSVSPLNSTGRYDQKKKKVVRVNYPNIVKMYNKHMGGVDLFDMLMALYRLDHKSKKWYRRIFLLAINLSIVNGWLIYKRQCALNDISGKNVLCLMEFSLAVSKDLMHVNQIPVNSAKKKRKTLFNRCCYFVNIDD